MKIKAKYTLLLFLVAYQLQAQEIRDFLPDQAILAGWKLSQGPQEYNGDQLFELIDGGADIYLEYGFNRMVTAHYTDPSSNNIQVEIYEMTDDYSAYGIFSLTQQTEEWTKEYGNLSAVSDDYISFWKNKYYINLSWSSRQHTEEPLLDTLAGRIADRVSVWGNYPELVRTFFTGEPGIKPVYLNGNLALSNFYYVDYKDIFSLTEGVAWNSGKYLTIIFKYDDPEKAGQTASSAKNSMSANKRFSDLTTAFKGYRCFDNKGNQLLVRQVENYIVVLVGLDKDFSLVPVMDDISRRIESQEN